MPTGVFANPEERSIKISRALKAYFADPKNRQKKREEGLRRKEQLGYINSPKTRQRISRAMKGKNMGETNPSKRPEVREKIRLARVAYWDERGRKTDGRPYHNSDARYASWREGVFERDDYTCQECGSRGGYLEAHHIKSWSQYPELRYELSNGLTMCKPCHPRQGRPESVL